MNDESSPMPLDDFASLQAGHAELRRGQKEMRVQMDQFGRDLKANTEVTNRIDKNTVDLIETFVSLQGGFKVLTWLAKAALPLAILWGGIKAYSLGLFK